MKEYVFVTMLSECAKDLAEARDFFERRLNASGQTSPFETALGAAEQIVKACLVSWQAQMNLRHCEEVGAQAIADVEESKGDYR